MDAKTAPQGVTIAREFTVKALAAVLPKLIAATEAGELDAHINAVTKAKQPVVAKR